MSPNAPALLRLIQQGSRKQRDLVKLSRLSPAVVSTGIRELSAHGYIVQARDGAWMFVNTREARTVAAAAK